MQSVILTDVFKDVVDLISADMGKTVNYQYGYVRELNQKIIAESKDPTLPRQTYPLIWLMEPITVEINPNNGYGIAENVSLFIINDARPDWLAEERMEINFRPILYPLYELLIDKIDLSTAFITGGKRNIVHKVTKRYYWGEQQKAVLNDPIDCLVVNFKSLQLAEPENCKPFKNF